MVKKLLKHEITNSYKYFTPVFIIGFVGTMIFTYLGLTTFQSQSNLNGSQTIIASLAVLLLFGLGVVAMVLTIGGLLSITYKSLYSVTGYRQFTYPITSRQRIIVKTITALFWNAVITLFLVALVALSITIIGFFNGETFQALITMFVNALVKSLTFDNLKDFAVFILNVMVGAIMQILIILFVGALANTSFVRKKRSLIAIVSYIGITWAINIIQGFVIYGMFGSAHSDGFLAMFEASSAFAVEQVTYVGILLNLIVCVLAYVGTEWLWDNKLEVLN